MWDGEPDLDRFWRLTPKEFSIIVNGASRRRIREHNDRAWLAWHIARLNAYAPAKSGKFIKLKELLHAENESRKPKQDWEAQLAATKAWMASRSRR